jgi:N-sulfoglucosamine sulfohydrolase
LLLITTLLTAGCGSGARKNGKKDPMNVIIITADDLGKQLSCYGDRIIETPIIDKLAARGMMFHNGYVTQASCSSSRSSILTGTWPHVNGQIGLAHRGFQMNGVYPNIAQSLKDQGYMNGVIGKIHIAPEAQFPFDFKRTRPRETWSMEMVSARADSFLTLAAGKPFFLYVNYLDPHVPFVRDREGHPREKVDPDDVHAFPWQGVDEPEELQRIADFYCCIKRLDEGIEMLMQKLADAGVLDHSIIVFLGDHGAPFARGKGACYESSLNVPYLISCPGITEPGGESNALVSTADIYPTVMDLLGFTLPGKVQGKSLLPVLTGEIAGVREHLFAEFNYHGHGLNYFFPRRTVRDGRYKLIYNVGAGEIDNQLLQIDGDKAYLFSRDARYDGTWVREIFDRFHQPPQIELYDLQQDPLEKNNLADLPSMADVKQELTGILHAWMKDTRDPFGDIESILAEIANPTVPQ